MYRERSTDGLLGSRLQIWGKTGNRMMFSLETSPLGRIISATTPEGRTLFYTTSDFPGALDADGAERIRRVASEKSG